ncbi:unnamed protein product [Acanthoscelides obtectus]|uniref:Uncharacterized protein n=1 Tax=Acanthoscelides obtectus TaxID=200917 RepID=A0A9P0PEA8_ACAOB|nr:unnamed protein product [Acanthoscelides obtectus]CAK1633723.1 hypothetical protein AOBTE_LOCUS8344 [Acanthoscelides obtectus]
MNWEDSMPQEETEEDSLTESASASGDGGTYKDIQRQADMRGKDSNEIEANTESAAANKEGGIEKSTESNQKHFKAPVGGAKKNKRKAVDMEETNRRMEEAYEIMKQCQNTEPPKTTVCTAYGQLVAKRLETLSEVDRIIVMNEIDNLFFRATMRSMGPQYQSPTSFYSSSMGPRYQSAFPEPASPASFYSSSSDETFHTTPTITSLPQNSATSSAHQPPLAPEIPITHCNDISLLTENYTNL